MRWILDYLKSVKKVKRLYEARLNECRVNKWVWVDTGIRSIREAFIGRPGKGKCLTASHWFRRVLFEGKKSGNYHKEMGANLFEKWLFCVFDIIHHIRAAK